jgi:tetratricopeptide (TPR) repeat protein
VASFDEALEEASLALVLDEDFDDAHAWLDDADELASDDIQRARALELRGCVHIAQRDYDEAIAVLLRAIELADETEEPSQAGVWGNLAYALDMTGQYDSAEEAHRACIEMLEEREGPEHPRTLRKVGDLACSMIGRGRFDEAEALLRRAVDGFDAQHGREPTWHVQAISNLGYFLFRSRCDAAAALACFDRALTLYEPGAVGEMIQETVRKNRAYAKAALAHPGPT